MTGTKRKPMITILLLTVILALVGIILWLVFGRAAQQGGTVGGGLISFDESAQSGHLPGKSDEEIQAGLNRIVEEGMFNISINPEIVMESGSADAALRIENVPGNQHLMSVEITLDDTGEVIYKSGLIEPNYHIQSAPLEKTLAAGTYAATATFYAHDADTEEVIGTAGAKITIEVQN